MIKAYLLVFLIADFLNYNIVFDCVTIICLSVLISNNKWVECVHSNKITSDTNPLMINSSPISGGNNTTRA